MNDKKYDPETGLDKEPFYPPAGEYLETSEDDPGEECGAEEEVEGEPLPHMDLHNCKPALPHQGYRQAVAYCQEDRQGRFWVVDPAGRNMTQVEYCPFCGVQCLDSTPPDKPMQVVPQDVALTPNDRPQRVWKKYQARVVMSHFQFGTVRVLASDGCHAKVLIEGERTQVTVCVENLEPLRGERTLPKVGEKKDKQPRKEKVIDPELMAKYLNMGL